jgi:hypothetical protein
MSQVFSKAVAVICIDIGKNSLLERKNKTSVERIVVLHGGIGPAPRRRALAALRFEER